jgi:uncharacterized protein
MTLESTSVNRRGFIGGVVAAAAAGTVASSLGALGVRAAGNPASVRRKPKASDYGPLAPVRDEATGLPLLLLPKGFEYISYGWTGDLMANGAPTPSSHDGMATFRKGRVLHLVRNHERGNGTPFADPGSTYDPTASGGTTNLVFDPHAGEWLDSYPSLSGTIRNCCGGPAPWGSWLTCEETTQVNNPGTADEVRHGFVYDVPADGTSDAVPLTQLGRYSHEALCVDPRSGIVYLTEDATPSGFYRFVPDRKGDLSSGRLQMLAIDGVPDTYDAPTGTSWEVTDWVDIDNPNPGPGELSTVAQGQAKGGTAITRGEGAWFGNHRAYFISTSGGPVGEGQVFEYDPRRDELSVLFASPAAATLNAPDNMTVSPRGGLVLCEDGSGEEFLHGLDTDGTIFPFASNAVDLTGGTAGKSVPAQDFRSSEWAGATFEPKHGEWLFANIQTPGITFAITGPWHTGAL